MSCDKGNESLSAVNFDLEMGKYFFRAIGGFHVHRMMRTDDVTQRLPVHDQTSKITHASQTIKPNRFIKREFPRKRENGNHCARVAKFCERILLHAYMYSRTGTWLAVLTLGPRARS